LVLGKSMKTCPSCGKQYSDEMSFCLEDGQRLIEASSSATPSGSRITMPEENKDPTFTTPPRSTLAQNPANINAPVRSNPWMWILIILLVLVLLCGGGGVACLMMLAAIGNNTEMGNNNSKVIEYPPPRESDLNTEYTKVLSDDLSSWRSPAKEIVASYSNGELILKTQPLYFCILATPNNNFRTDNALVTVRARNITGQTVTYGFGLVIHADQRDPLQGGYCFLIDSATQMYRITRQFKGQEQEIKGWQHSEAIKPGKEENILQVLDNAGKMSFYVNGVLLDEYRDEVGIRSGIVGLYASEDNPIAFSNLEIKRK